MRTRAFVALTVFTAAAVACAGSAPKAVTGTPAEVDSATPPAALPPLPPPPAAASAPPAESFDASDGAAGALSSNALNATETDGGGGPTQSTSASACNEQPPQDFLIRGNFLKDPHGNQRAIQYRTDEYGYFKGFGRAGPDAKPPSASLVDATFFGLRVKMHRKVAPVLACVEEEIRLSCADHPYVPHALAGIRYRNTYRGGEVTNHAYGIAIDVDPSLNTCCGCVPPWNDAPACKRPSKSEYGHMAMPECWVHAFERYGFYWLGHDVLKDTMHFEFLGDPDRIVKGAPPTAPEKPHEAVQPR